MFANCFSIKKQLIFKNFFTLLFIFAINLLNKSNAISYRCENNQILIVQNFGNDRIRMHCQKLNLCGVKKLVKTFISFFF